MLLPPPELAEVIALAGPGRLLSAEEITVLPTLDGQRKTYRLTFEGGVVLKARRFLSTELAAIAERILSSAKLPFMPRMLARHLDTTLEEWLEGEVLVEGRVNSAGFRQAGEMLGALHSLVPPPADGTGFVPKDEEWWAERLRSSLTTLREAGVAKRRTLRKLEELALRHKPDASLLGVVHRDLCPENLLLSSDKRIFSIDNGNLAIGPIEEDLCRTRYRWPMSEAEESEFAIGYGRFQDPVAFLRPSPFWAIVVVTTAARLHLVKESGASARILEQLGRVACAPELRVF